jgi:hypothetical protein
MRLCRTASGPNQAIGPSRVLPYTPQLLPRPRGQAFVTE